MPLKSFSFFLSFFLTTRKSQKSQDSLNYVIFLNIFYTVMLSMFFVTIPKKKPEEITVSATRFQVVHVKMLKHKTVLNSFSFESILVGP